MDDLTLLTAMMANWINHPGWNREGAKAPSMEQCLEQANQLLQLIEEHKWRQVHKMQQQPQAPQKPPESKQSEDGSKADQSEA